MMPMKRYHQSWLPTMFDDFFDNEWMKKTNATAPAINVIESGMSLMCCRTVGVIAPAEVRVKRIMARDGIEESYARMRIAAQKADTFYHENCTDVLENTEESPQAFEEKALAFFARLIKEET